MPIPGVAAMALVLASGISASAPVQARGYDLAVSHTLATPADAASVTAFWLAHDGRALISATPYAPETGIAARRAVREGPAPYGKPGVVTAVAETRKLPAARGTDQGAARPKRDGSQGVDQKSGTSKNVNLPRTIGKAFFIGTDGRPHWCSATSVRSDHANLVATAGHCVYDLGPGAAPLRNWIFIPEYRQGKAPWGVYVGRQAFTHHDFATYGDVDRDYAFVNVHSGLTPRRSELVDTGRLGDQVGGQGLAYNLRIGRPLVIIGHPAGGGTLTRSSGRSFGAADPAIRATELVGMRSVREAATGSPWLAGYRSTRGLGYLNGLTIGVSGSGRAATATSPYFDGELYVVYDAARRFST